MPAPRFPRSKCRAVQDCDLCHHRVKPGSWMGKDFSTNEWVHLGCLIQKINRPLGQPNLTAT